MKLYCVVGLPSSLLCDVSACEFVYGVVCLERNKSKLPNWRSKVSPYVTQRDAERIRKDVAEDKVEEEQEIIPSRHTFCAHLCVCVCIVFIYELCTHCVVIHSVSLLLIETIVCVHNILNVKHSHTIFDSRCDMDLEE